MATKVLLLTEEQHCDMKSFWENVGPDYTSAGSIDQADLVAVVGDNALNMYSQQITLAIGMNKSFVFAEDMEQAEGKIRACNDMPGNRNMEFAHDISYER